MSRERLRREREGSGGSGLNVAAAGAGARLRTIGGNFLGAVASVSLDGITTAVGLTLGYRDDVWTNWYRRNTMLGVLTLAYMRNQLNKHNLLSTYPRDRLIGWLKPGQVGTLPSEIVPGMQLSPFAPAP